MNQTVLNNGAHVFAYGKEASVAPGAQVKVCEFYAPSVQRIAGLTLGMGISDVSAWGIGAQFELHINGRQVLIITDQIADLLRPEFMPIEINGKSNVELYFKNGTVNALDVAATVRVEA